MTRAIPWLLVAALTAGAGVLVYQLRAAQVRAGEVQRLAEAERLRAAGLAVVEYVEDDELARRVLDLEDALGEALASAERAAPGSRPVSVVRASTGPVIARGVARRADKSNASARQDGDIGERDCARLRAIARDCSPIEAAGVVPAQAGASSSHDAPACLLAHGDTAEIRVDQVTLETRRGGQYVLGAASAWRLSPGPVSRVAGGIFSARVTTAAGVAPEPPALAGWGVGGAVLGTAQGVGLGLAVAAPPVTLWGVSLEPSAIVGWGSGGPVATLAVIAR